MGLETLLKLRIAELSKFRELGCIFGVSGLF